MKFFLISHQPLQVEIIEMLIYPLKIVIIWDTQLRSYHLYGAEIMWHATYNTLTGKKQGQGQRPGNKLVNHTISLLQRWTTNITRSYHVHMVVWSSCSEIKKIIPKSRRHLADNSSKIMFDENLAICLSLRFRLSITIGLS